MGCSASGISGASRTTNQITSLACFAYSRSLNHGTRSYLGTAGVAVETSCVVDAELGQTALTGDLGA